MANPNKLNQLLSTVGLGQLDACDPLAITKKLQEKMKELQEDVKETINALSAKAFGTFLATVAILMAQVAAGVGLAALEAIVVGGIFGNIIGTVSLLIGLVLASLAGAEIMLKYLATKRYHDKMIKRIELGRALDSELTQMMSFFYALQDSLEEASGLNTESIQQALKHVRDASVKVGSESSRIQSGNRIDAARIEDAQDDIDEAISDLTFGSFGEVSEQLKELQEEFDIEVELGFLNTGVPNPVGFVNYINRLNQKINEKYFSEDLSPAERKQNMQEVKSFFLRLIPILPKTIQRAAYVKTFQSRSDRLFDMIPVEAAAFQGQLESALGGDLQVQLPEELLQFFEVNDPQDIEPVDIEQNYNELSIEIGLAETAILNLTSWMDEVRFEAGVFKNMLLPASKKLSKVRGEMNSYILQDIDSIAEQMEVSSKKIDWSIELSTTKGLLRAAIGPSITFNGIETNPNKDMNIFEEADEIYEELQVLIREQREDDFPTDVYNLAQRYLSKLVATPTVLLIPGAAKSTLAGLQGIRFAVREQIKLDEQGKALSQQFLHKVEQSTYFNQVIRPSWNEFVSAMQSSQVAQGVIGELMKGDLSSLVTALRGVQTANIVGDALNCFGVDVPDASVRDAWDVLAKKIGSEFETDGDQSFEEWYKDFKANAKQSINTLEDKKAQLNVLISQVDD